MKKLALSALFLMLLVGPAAAHDGALSIYTDETLVGCSKSLDVFVDDTIRMYYVRDNGPDLGQAVEFRIEITTLNAVLSGYFWNPLLTVYVGDIFTDLSLTASQCLGQNEQVVYIGSLIIMAFAVETFNVGVRDALNAQPPGVYITECLPSNPIHQVLGGTFVYNGSCIPGVKETTWGAIKQLYK